ncbi:MAG: MMPL family transporter [Aeromicrobium sp.]
MSSLLYRFGRTTALHPWRTLVGWLIVAACVFAASSAFGGTTQDDWNVPGAESQHGIELLRDHLPDAGNASANVVVHDDRAIPPAVLTSLGDRLQDVAHVSSVSPPRVSADGHTAVVHLAYDAEVTHPDLMGDIDPLEEAVEATRDAGFQVELGGDQPSTASAPIKGYGELIGVGAALLILLIAFGSAVVAGLPVVIAVSGLAVGSAGVTILAATLDVSTSAPMVASMVGLGVGIDYALLLVSRHAEFLAQGHSVEEAAGRSLATAGKSVVFASLTVLISLLGLGLTGLPTFATFGWATAIAVVAVMLTALTMVPVLCRLAGRKVLARGLRRGRVSTERPLTARWAERVTRRPVLWALLGTTVMIALAAPVLDMRTWPQDDGNQTTEATTRRAYDLTADAFGPGATGPITVVVDHAALATSEVAAVRDTLASNDDLVSVSPPITSPDGAVTVLTAEPAFGPADARTSGLVDDLRADLPDGVEVTGQTPLFADIAEMLSHRLWVVIGFVVAVSVLLLTLVFRSVVIPLKAAAMNLLSIGAAYGVMTAVFQWGWGASLLGIDHAAPVSSWVPILIFAILFGLSMDYEVFLLSRIREKWLDTGDSTASIVHGLSASGKVITAAAAIMVFVFLGFATEGDLVVKMLGLGMATAVFLDATVVRMILVPATMTLLGKWNWWLPTWLDRALPQVDVEGAEADLVRTR